jgi:site-specific recombinase XerD
MDAGLGPSTIGALLSCLRGFLRYLRDERHLRVLDAEKIKRPRIPQRTVEYLTKEELDLLLDAIPTHTWNGLRDRALIEVLFSSGMRISADSVFTESGTIKDPDLPEAVRLSRLAPVEAREPKTDFPKA